MRLAIALTVGALAVSATAALAAPGDLDPTFGTGGVRTFDFNGDEDHFRDVLLQPDGKVVAVGAANAVKDFAVVRLNADGSSDPSFDGDGVVTVDFGASDAATTVARTRKAYVYPARHFASDSEDPDLPRMGERLRLKAGFDVSGFPPQARVVLEALKRYGMLLADNGSDWFISGAPSAKWDNDDLRSLGQVPGSAFEVVDTSGLPRPQDGG